MTKLLDRALEAARRLSAEEQDELARLMLQLVGDEIAPTPLTDAEREAIARSKAAAAKGEFATDEQVRAVWSKYAE